MPVWCEICEKSFSAQFNLNKHRKKIHGLASKTVSYDTSIFNYKCLELNCNNSFKFNTDLVSHLKDIHQFNIVNQEIIFNNFEEWKNITEQNEHTSYIKPRGMREVKCETSVVQYFICNRSARAYAQKTGCDRKRQEKSQGSCKVKSACISQIKITIKQDGIVHMNRCSTHYGHKLDIQHLRIDTKNQYVIASKLISGVSNTRILDSDHGELKRIDLITRQDVANIKKKFHVDIVDGVRNKDDATSVDLWVEESKKSTSDPILFYKKQGETSDILKTEDFCLIIMNEFQIEMFRQFGKNIICVDGTHGVNNYEFELNTVMVIDEYNEGYPVAIMFSNRKDTYIMSILFENIKLKCGVVSANVFMSDICETYYNAWKATMGDVNHQIYCSWHVDRAWQQNLNKINDLECRDDVYKTLKVLQQTLDVSSFHDKLELFIKNLLEGASTKTFGMYFQQNYCNNYTKWAYCYRKSVGINTNMHLENMHKIIKYFYIERKKVKRLDKGLHAVLKYIRDKTVDRIIKQTKGKSTAHIKNIFNRHRSAITSSFNVVEKSDISWSVSSEDKEYLVEEISKIKCCNLICTICQICVHIYTCTCLDFFIKYTVCKHIHTIGIRQKFNQGRISIEVESSVVHENICNAPNIRPTEDIKKSLHENLKKNLVELHAKVSLMDVTNTDYEMLKNMSSHIKVLQNLVNSSTVSGDTGGFQNISNDHVNNKVIKKQKRFHSTQKKRKIKNNKYKKSNHIQSKVIENFLSGNRDYISDSTSYDHSYSTVSEL